MAMGIEQDRRTRAAGGPFAIESIVRVHERLALCEAAPSIHQAAIEAARREFDASAACLIVREGDIGRCAAQWGYPEAVIERYASQPVEAQNPGADAPGEGRLVLVRDAQDFDAKHPQLMRLAPSLAAHAALPLAAGGRTFGTLFLSWREPRGFSASDESILRAMAGLVAQALWRARLLETSERSRAALAEYMDTATIGLHWVAADGTILWANEADHKMLGYSRAEYVGRNIAEFHADATNLAEILKCLLAGERIINRRALLRHKDGSMRHVLIDSSAQRDDKGNFLHTRCFTRDVTLFIEQRDRYEALVAAQSELGDGVLICDNERAEWVNDAYCRLLGFTREEILSPDFRLADRLAPPEHAAAERRIRERQEGRLQHTYDVALLRKDGSLVDCNISVKALAAGPNPRRIAIVRDFTERKRSERALAEQRDLYDALLHAESDLGQGVVLARVGREATYANDAFAMLTGRTLKELTAPGFDLTSLTPAEERERLARMLDLSNPRAALHYQTRIQRPDGSLIDVEVASLGLTIHNETYRLALCRDITADLQARRAQEREESELKRRDAFLTSATLQILETSLNPDETLRLVARLATEELADYANVDLLQGEADLQRVVIAHKDPEKAAVIERYLARCPSSPRVRKVIESIPRGEVRITNDIPQQAIDAYAATEEERDLVRTLGLRHVMLVPLIGRSGLLGFVGFTRSQGAPFTEVDAFVAKSLVTRCALGYENAKLHTQSRALEAKWRALAEQHRRVLDTAPAQVLTIDGSGRILTINRSVRGADPTHAIGLNAYDTVTEEDRERVRGIIENVMRTGEPAEYETRGIIGPGESRWFNVRVGPLDIGEERGAVLISTDIEDKKQAEREMAQVRAELLRGEKLSALGSLVSGVAHELRTPLTFLNNNAFLLKRRLDEAKRQGMGVADVADAAERHIHEITAGVDRIDQLVEDLRRYTKAAHEAKHSVTTLDDVVRDAVELFRATSRHSHVLEAHLRPTARIQANPGAIQQVALNLLQNAADAMASSGVIRISTRDEPDAVVLEVRDEGSGIPPSVQKRMFDPLFTTKPQGTGLGLSIVKRILDEHKATIECESAVGQGTTFRVRFPRHRAD